MNQPPSPGWTELLRVVHVRRQGEIGSMLTAAGNINQEYTSLGVIHAVVTKPAKQAGCSGAGGLLIREAVEAVLEALKASAAKSGGDGLVHVSYDYRVSSTSMACNQSKAVIEVYGWGTVIRLEPSP